MSKSMFGNIYSNMQRLFTVDNYMLFKIRNHHHNVLIYLAHWSSTEFSKLVMMTCTLFYFLSFL